MTDHLGLADYLNIQTAATVAATGLLTYFSKWAYDRWLSDHLAPPEALLRKLEKRGTLSNTGRSRLLDICNARRLDLCQRFPLPKQNHPGIQWPNNPPRVVLRSSNVPFSKTSCPNTALSNIHCAYARINPAKGEVPVADGHAFAHSLGSELSLALQNETLDHQLLSLRDKDEKMVPVFLWVNACEFIWPSLDHVMHHFQLFYDSVHRKFPYLELILEIAVSDDLISERRKLTGRDEVLQSGSQLTHLGPPVDYGMDDAPLSLQYLHARNAKHRLLQNGGLLSLDDYRLRRTLPRSLLDARLQPLYSRLSLSDWKCLCLYGSPGAGKSELTLRLAHHLVDEENAIVLVVSILDFQNGATNINSRTSEYGSASHTLVQMLKRRIRRSLPDNPVFDLACDHVAERFVREYRERLVLLVDDIDHLKLVRQAMLNILNSLKDSGVRVILISRRDPSANDLAPFVDTSEAIRTFNSDEAAVILSSWLPASQGRALSDILRQDWISRVPELSLYLLRLIAETLDHSSHQPSWLLRQAIQTIARPLSNVLRGGPTDHLARDFVSRTSILLGREDSTKEDIKAILPKSSDVDLVHVLGNLAWMSKYQDREPITPGALMSWAGEAVPDVQTADLFIKEGIGAGIFKGSMSAVVWSDQFLADACAVMRIQSEENTGTVAELTTELVEQGASEILGLAADYDTLSRIVRAILEDNRKVPIKVLNGIFSPQTVQSLARHPELYDMVCMKLLGLAGKLDTGDDLTLSKLVASLADESKTVKAYIRESLTSHKPIGAFSALVWAQLRTPSQYENDCKELDTVCVGTALFAAAMTWLFSDGNRLLTWCTTRFDIANLNKEAYVSVWCDCRRLSEVLELLSRSMKAAENDADGPYGAEWVLNGVMNSLRRRQSGLSERDRGSVEALLVATFRDSNSEVLRNKVFTLLVDVCQPKLSLNRGKWLRDKKGTCFVPSEPIDHTRLAEILNLTGEKTPNEEGRIKVTLAQVKDLKNVRDIQYDGAELVGDALYERLGGRWGAKWGEEIPITDWSALLTWDGRQKVIAERPPMSSNPADSAAVAEGIRIGNVRFRWRPVLCVD